MPERAEQTSPSIQPPDFLLPRAGLQRSKQAKFFLSWDGEIYGPATESEILAGMRASSFGENVLYWHEGSDGWKPLEEFLSDEPMAAPDEWHRPKDTVEQHSSPTTSRKTRRKSRPKRGHRSPRGEKPHPRMGGNQIPLLIFGIVLVAVLLTVSILLLLMRIG